MSRVVLPFAFVAAACGQSAEVPAGPAHWILVEDFVAGQVGDDLELTRVIDLLPAPGDGFAVTQYQVGAVQLADGRGSPVGQIGRSGGGPGEFSQPTGMGWLGDTLWVADHYEVELFSPAGEHRGRFGFRHALYPGQGVSYGPGVPLNNGLLVGTASYSFNRTLSGELTSVPILVTDRSGVIVDTLGHLQLGNRSIRVSLGEGGAVLIGAHPLPPTPDHEVAPDGSYVVRVELPHEGAFRVTKLSSDLDTPFSVEVPFQAMDLSEEWVSEFVDEHAGPIAASTGTPLQRVAEGFRKALNLGVSPPVRALVAGGDGTTWLKREPREGEMARWEVFDEQGLLEALVSIPEDMTVYRASRVVVWGIRPGGYDEPVVHRYRVRVEPSSSDMRPQVTRFGIVDQGDPWSPKEKSDQKDLLDFVGRYQSVDHRGSGPGDESPKG